MARLASVGSLALLIACTDQEAQQAGDQFADALGEFFLVLMLFAIIAVIVWALIVAGAVAAIMAGIRRLRRDDEQPPQQAHGTQGSATPGDAPASPSHQAQKRQPDRLGIGLIVFGAVLLASAGPGIGGWELFGSSRSRNYTVTISLESLILAAVVAGIVLIVRKRRR